MLRSATELRGYTLQAKDDELGRCKDFLFDDELWTVRYMVADTRKWLPGRKVLISPISLGTPDWGAHRFPVLLTRQEVEAAPSIDEDAPVSRQYEIQYHRHYNWPGYWMGPGVWGGSALAAPLFNQPGVEETQETAESGDAHLRSMNEVKGYSIQNQSEDLGTLHDFIVEEGSWSVRYIVVDTGRWLPGRRVLIPPTWIESVSWKDHAVAVWLSREEVKASPPYDPAAPVNREYEELLYDYYGRPSYWEHEAGVHTASR